MKYKAFFILSMIILASVVVVADQDGTKWSIRGDVKNDYIMNLEGLESNDLGAVQGYVNLYTNVGNNKETQGALHITAWDKEHQKWITHTITWSSQEIPFTLKGDTGVFTSYSGKGVEQWGSGAEARNRKVVPLSIYYNKPCHRVTIKDETSGMNKYV